MSKQPDVPHACLAGRGQLTSRIWVDLPHPVKWTTGKEKVQRDDDPSTDDDSEANVDANEVAACEAGLKSQFFSASDCTIRRFLVLPETRQYEHTVSRIYSTNSADLRHQSTIE